MWRPATSNEYEQIVEMSRALYAEDPAPMPVPERHTRQTLATLHAEPARGVAVVLEIGGAIAGYALLISFWSNELGGEVIVLDELYVRAPYRGRGHGRALLVELTSGGKLWPRLAVAVELEVTPGNPRAESLYTTAGFRPVKNKRLRCLRSNPQTAVA